MLGKVIVKVCACSRREASEADMSEGRREGRGGKAGTGLIETFKISVIVLKPA